MKNSATAWTYVLIVAALSLVAASQVRASDYENTRHPLFEGVERVYINVHYAGWPDEPAEQAKFPKALRKDKIEALLVQLYTERFSSKDCLKRLHGKNPYGCNDQPVLLLADHEFNKNDTMKARQRPGTLNVHLLALYEESSPSGQVAEPKLVAVALVQDRPEPDFPADWGLWPPMPFSLDWSDEEIQRQLFEYIANRIH